jgi:hypothetical protein
VHALEGDDELEGGDGVGVELRLHRILIAGFGTRGGLLRLGLLEQLGDRGGIKRLLLRLGPLRRLGGRRGRGRDFGLLGLFLRPLRGLGGLYGLGVGLGRRRLLRQGSTLAYAVKLPPVRHPRSAMGMQDCVLGASPRPETWSTWE